MTDRATLRTAFLLVCAVLTMACSPGLQGEYSDAELEHLGIAHSYDEILTEEDVTHITTSYLAITSWAETIHTSFAAPLINPETTATVHDPIIQDEANRGGAQGPHNHDMRSALLSLPHTTCAWQLRNDPEGTGGSKPERLGKCVYKLIVIHPPGDWDKASELERSTRATANLLNVWHSIDPSLAVAVKFATQQRVPLSPDNNPDFRKFAESYASCKPTDRDVDLLSSANTPKEMAEAWHNSYQRMRNCTSEITQSE